MGDIVIERVADAFAETVQMIGRQPDFSIINVEPDAGAHAFEERRRFELALLEIGSPENETAKAPTLPIERIEQKIILLRNEKVLLDADLAAMYGVTTKAFNQAVKRNLDRFPDDFLFQLTADEVEILRSQNVTSNARGGRRYAPYAFTEQGVAMLSGVLRSERAVAVNVQIMRTFVRLRQMLSSNAELARKLGELEKKDDSQFKMVFDAIRALTTPSSAPKRPPIGFQGEGQKSSR